MIYDMDYTPKDIVCQSDMICLWARFSCWIYPPRHSGVPVHALLHVQFLHGVHDMDLHGIPCALGIALVAQFAADTCREAGLCAASTAIELCGRVLVLLQALPLLRSLLGSFADYLQ